MTVSSAAASNGSGRRGKSANGNGRPAPVYRPPGADHPGVPWREAMNQVDDPVVGTEGVAREAMEMASAKRKSLIREAATAREHKVNVLIEAEDSGITVHRALGG